MLNIFKTNMVISDIEYFSGPERGMLLKTPNNKSFA